MKALSWILVLVFLAATGFLFVNGKKTGDELAVLKQEHAQLSEAHTALEQADQTASQNSQDSLLSKKEREELIPLAK